MKKRVVSSILALCFVTATGAVYAAPAADTPKFTIGGETRIRYVSDDPAVGTQLNGPDNLEFRQRIKFSGVINEDMTFTGRLATAGGNKWGATDGTTGSDIKLDIMNITAKNLMGVDSVRVGRSALDFFGTGLMGKPMNVDGILINDKMGDVQFKGWTGNVKSNTTGDAQQLTTAQIGWNAATDLNLRTGYYVADIPGTSTATGMGTLNTNVGSFNSSKGWLVSADYKMDSYTVLFDYIGSKLDNAVGLPDDPTGWVVQVSNSKGPKVLYPGVNLVSPIKKGDDAWMVSYRSVEAGTLPSGAGGYDTTAVAYPANPYSAFTHTTDNVDAWFIAYQNVVAKNTILSFEYQDIKVKDRQLTGLSSDKLDKTFMTKLEFFY